jgi:hypothetical protein
MNRFGALILLPLSVVTGSEANPDQSVASAIHIVRAGMDQNEVRKTIGVPQHTTRLVLFRRHLEQWQYSEPPAVVEFNVVRGEPAAAIHVFRGQK